MIDIHSHILPGVDDGSDSMETSVGMLRMAEESGVKVIAATPHCNIPGEFGNYASDGLNALFQELYREKQRAGLKIALVKGMEVYTTSELPALYDDGLLWTLNGTRYLLMEFAFGEDPAFASEMLAEMQKRSVIPVIAHPERYYFIQNDPAVAYDWVTSGCVLQINKGSLLGRFGPGPEALSQDLLTHNLAACVASDAHGTDMRTTDLLEVRYFLDRHFGENLRKLVLEINPARILSGKPLLGYDPMPM